MVTNMYVSFVWLVIASTSVGHWWIAFILETYHIVYFNLINLHIQYEHDEQCTYLKFSRLNCFTYVLSVVPLSISLCSALNIIPYHVFVTSNTLTRPY